MDRSIRCRRNLFAIILVGRLLMFVGVEIGRNSIRKRSYCGKHYVLDVLCIFLEIPAACVIRTSKVSITA